MILYGGLGQKMKRFEHLYGTNKRVKDMGIVTRNFYDCASVEAAFMASVVQKNPLRKQLMVFWINELRLSKEYDKIFDILTRAWYRCPPIDGALAAWLAMREEPENDDRILDFVGFLQLPVNAISDIMSPYPPPPETSRNTVLRAEEMVPNLPADWSESQRIVLLRAVNHAVAKSNGERIYCLLGNLAPATAIAYLPTLNNACTPLLQAYRKNKKAMIQLLGSIGMWRHIPAPTATLLKWPDIKVGRLSARMFSVPAKLMHERLDPAGLDILHGCRFWQEIIQQVGIDREQSEQSQQLVFETAEACEKFYNHFFPDDIPDEWPPAETRKSHCHLAVC
jgi:hypothetical protein